MSTPATQPQGERVPLRHRDKVAYVLGAGFSVEAGVPLLPGFLRHSFRMLKGVEGSPSGTTREKHDRELAGELVNLLNRYASIASVMEINLENLEDLFCLVDLPSGLLPDQDSDGDKDRGVLNGVIIRTLCKAEQDYERRLREQGAAGQASALAKPQSYLLAEIGGLVTKQASETPRGLCPYEAFVLHLLQCQQHRRVDEREFVYNLDAVITLNYDLLIEKALDRLFTSAPIYYGHDVVSPDSKRRGWKDVIPAVADEDEGKRRAILPLVKMHGSINWCYEPAQRPPSRRRGSKSRSAAVRRMTESERLQYVREIRDPCPDDPRNDVRPEDVPLVPPTWKRQLSRDSVFGKLVSEAIRHLRQAAKIVIIGYSMPETDKHFRYVLAKGLQTPEFPEIEVWDVKSRSDMEDNLARTFGGVNLDRGHIQYYDTGLRGFVQERIHRRREPGPWPGSAS